MADALLLLRGLRWNLVGLPARAALGFGVGALSIRLLARSGEEAVGSYGYVLALAGTCLAWAHLGMPAVLARELSKRRIDRKDGVSDPLWWHTSVLRSVAAVVIAALVLAVGAGVPEWTRAGSALGGEAVLVGLLLLRVVCMDWKTGGEAWLSAAMRRGRANLARVAGLTLWLVALALALAGGAAGLRAALWCAVAAGVLECVLVVGLVLGVQRLSGGRSAGGGWRDSVGFWRETLPDCGNLYGDKLLALLLGPHTVVLASAILLDDRGVGVLYVLTEFAQKCTALVVVPLSGLLLPLFVSMRRDELEGRREFGPRLGLGHLVVVSHLAALAVGGLSCLVFPFLYGPAFAERASGAALLAAILTVDAALQATMTAESVAGGRSRGVLCARLAGVLAGAVGVWAWRPDSVVGVLAVYVAMRLSVGLLLMLRSGLADRHCGWRGAWFYAATVWGVVAAARSCTAGLGLGVEALGWVVAAGAALLLARVFLPTAWGEIVRCARSLLGRRQMVEVSS